MHSSHCTLWSVTTLKELWLPDSIFHLQQHIDRDTPTTILYRSVSLNGASKSGNFAAVSSFEPPICRFVTKG